MLVGTERNRHLSGNLLLESFQHQLLELIGLLECGAVRRLYG
jgi:hypothetical protein